MSDGSLSGWLCRRERIGGNCAAGSPSVRRWIQVAGALASRRSRMADLSRRPHVTPKRSEATTEARVVAVRDKHPAWGARKIARCLKREGLKVTVPSTVHQILCRNGRVKPTENAPPNPGHRFEKEAQSAVADGLQGLHATEQWHGLHPLTMVDDHSRYALCLKACANEQRLTVQDHREPLSGAMACRTPLHRQRLAMGR